MGSLSNQKGYKIIGKFDYEPFYFMTSKQNKELLIALDNAITNIKISNPSFEFLLHKNIMKIAILIKIHCLHVRKLNT